MKTNYEKTALLVIDMQNDFLEGGALAVPDSLSIIKPVNTLIDKFDNVIFSQDWHPENHSSFDTLWPPHCIAGTYGAQIHKDINTNKAQLILRKGYQQNIDSYSAFFDNDHQTSTGLEGYLKQRGVNNLFICGLALDFCVAYTALDAKSVGFNVSIVLSACKAIDTNGSLNHALNQFQENQISLPFAL